MVVTYDPLAEASWSILGSNVSNVLEVGTTLPGTFVRLYTDDNTTKGHLIGSSNVLQTDNYFYVATQVGSNTGRIDLSIRNGNIGVGQSNPATRLHVSGGDLWLSGSNSLLWGPGSGPANARTVVDSNGLIHRDAVYTDLKTQWVNDGSNILFSRGNIGVRTSNPQFELDVLGTIRTTDITMSSDARLKHDIQELETKECRELLERLRPVSYEWNNLHCKPSTGFIAQEILEATEGTRFAEYLLRRPEYSGMAGGEPMWTVNYMALIAPMVQVMKDMQRRIDALEKSMARE